MSTLLTHARHAASATIVAAGIALAAPALADPNLYAVRNLVSDVPGAA